MKGHPHQIPRLHLPNHKDFRADQEERALTRKKLVREIKRIDASTNNLVDNGLFDKRSTKLFGNKQQEEEDKKVRAEMDTVFDTIQVILYMARKSLENDDLAPLSIMYSSLKGT